MSKKLLMVFAEGYETGEALVPVDVLRRGGVEVTMASITDEMTVTSAQGIGVGMNEKLSELKVLDFDAIVLPGGMPGTTHLGESELVKNALISMNEAGKLVAAICAAPGVLGKYGLLKGKKACCYPGLEGNLTGAEVTMDKVTIDGNIVTSRGLGTAMDFGLTLLALLESEEVSQNIRHSIVYQA